MSLADDFVDAALRIKGNLKLKDEEGFFISIKPVEPGGLSGNLLLFVNFESGAGEEFEFDTVLPHEFVMIDATEVAKIDFWDIIGNSEIIVSNSIRKQATVTIRKLTDEATKEPHEISVGLEISYRDADGRARTWLAEARIPLEKAASYFDFEG